MRSQVSRLFLLTALLLGPISSPVHAAWEPRPLSDEEMQKADAIYQTYSSLCHGEDRQGYRADHASSLRSKSLLSTGLPDFIFYTIGWGRTNTAMDGYSEEMGGPLSDDDLLLLTNWLAQVDPLEIQRD